MIVQAQKAFNKRELEALGYNMDDIRRLMSKALAEEIMKHISNLTLEEIESEDYVTVRKRLYVYETEC